MRKPFVILALAAVGATGGYLIWPRGPTDAAAGGLLRLHGNVELRDLQLAFFGQERIAEVLVEEGDRVVADQVLARLRTERLDAEIAGARARIAAQQALVERLDNGTRAEDLDRARAEVEAAEVQVRNAERAIERVRATQASGASSAQDLDDADARLDVARAELEVRSAALRLAVAGPRDEDRAQARSTLAALESELALLERRRVDSELRAPSAGIVQTRILEAGEMAAPERPVFTMVRTDPKWVRAYVAEPDLGRIALGRPATVRSDSFGGRGYEAQVGFVSPVAEFTPKTIETAELRTRLVYEVRVFVRDPRDELRLGMPVTVEIDNAAGGSVEGR
jgi:HlyD family secretion protein